MLPKVGDELGKRKNAYIFAPEPKHHGRTALIWVLSVVAVLVLGVLGINFVINHQVRLDSFRLTVQNLPEDLENWSILHISDLQGQEIGSGQSGIQSAISGKSYSCVVFTGDMVGKDGNVQPFLDLIALLPASTPKFLIAGDSDPSALVDATAHGSLSVYADWVTKVQQAGVTVLDEPLSVTRGKSTIWFVPEYYYSLDLDSMETAYQNQLSSLNETSSGLSPDEAARKRVAQYQLEKIARIREIKKTITAKNDVQIAVTHVPVTREEIDETRAGTSSGEIFSIQNAALILAGHFCGGQWRLPGGGAMYVPDYGWWPEDENLQGLNYLRGVPQYISPGLGASDYYPFPGRLFNQPVVTLIYLTSRVV